LKPPQFLRNAVATARWLDLSIKEQKDFIFLAQIQQSIEATWQRKRGKRNWYDFALSQIATKRIEIDLYAMPGDPVLNEPPKLTYSVQYGYLPTMAVVVPSLGGKL